MPAFDSKRLARELKEGKLPPALWVHGPERFLAAEILRLLNRALKDSGENWETLALEGAGLSPEEVIDQFQSLSLFSGKRFLVIRDAHEIKGLERLEAILAPAAPLSEIDTLALFLAKDLDGRKKSSKLLMEKAAVVECAEIREDDRETWIQFLAKRKNVDLSPAAVSQLRALDPWSLDLIDQELEKLALYRLSKPKQDPDAADGPLLATDGPEGGTERFIDAFFQKRSPLALEFVSQFADQADETLPLLGLLSWNVRQMIAKPARMNPYLAQKFARWSKHWNLASLIELHRELSEIDFATKQRPLSSKALWTDLVLRFRA